MVLLEGDMKDTGRVVIFDAKGRPIAYYKSMEDVATVYQSSVDTIRMYINNGKYWKKKHIFLDFVIEVN